MNLAVLGAFKGPPHHRGAFDLWHLERACEQSEGM